MGKPKWPPHVFGNPPEDWGKTVDLYPATFFNIARDQFDIEYTSLAEHEASLKEWAALLERKDREISALNQKNITLLSEKAKLEEVARTLAHMADIGLAQEEKLQSRLSSAERRIERLREALGEFQLGHEHKDGADHIRVIGEARGWCDFCNTRVFFGPGDAEKALAEDHAAEGKAG